MQHLCACNLWKSYSDRLYCQYWRSTQVISKNPRQRHLQELCLCYGNWVSNSATVTPHCPLSPLRRIKEIKGRIEWLQLHTHCLWGSCYLCFTTGSSLEPTIPFMASSTLLGNNTWDEACSWCSCTIWGGPVSGAWCKPVDHLSRVLTSPQSWLPVLGRRPLPCCLFLKEVIPCPLFSTVFLFLSMSLTTLPLFPFLLFSLVFLLFINSCGETSV